MGNTDPTKRQSSSLRDQLRLKLKAKRDGKLELGGSQTVAKVLRRQELGKEPQFAEAAAYPDSAAGSARESSAFPDENLAFGILDSRSLSLFERVRFVHNRYFDSARVNAR